jgi:SAM-dependent methyltransferase
MTATGAPPDWSLPEGVDAALWNYAGEERLALNEDAYFHNHPLLRADRAVLEARFDRPGSLIDLGCGTGRLSVRFAELGFRVVAVDLSAPMLRAAAARAERSGVRVAPLRANLCRLECIPDQSFDYAISMFSTLGMIRGASARGRAIAEASRILRVGGRLALHAHNLWLNLRDSQGRIRLAKGLFRSLAGGDPIGDVRMTYRGVPNMYVHLFTWRELAGALKSRGFRIDEVLPIDEIDAEPIVFPRLAHSLRAGGWIVFCTRVR